MSRRSKEKARREMATVAMPPSAPVSPADLNERGTVIGICIFLAVITFAVFGQTLRYEFVNFDDDEWVYKNPAISQGVGLNGVFRAFTQVNVQEWYPLTALSHMLDWQLYGLKPGGHHLTNVLLHTATTMLLFLMLRSMTGATWRCAFVAAVFAIHPLRVESVAWVTERKDVLSGLFFMLILWAYVRYVREPKSRSRGGVSFLRSPFYWLVLLLFALGLLSKTMLVTLPFVLLLLDYWPLKRVPPSVLAAPRSPRRAWFVLFLEKIPFLVLTAAACVVTILVARNGIKASQGFDWPSRVGNAFVSYVAYLGQMLYPVGLAVLYPHPGNRLSVWKVGLSLLVLLAISAGVITGQRKHPYLLVGWLWYLGMLVPVIGLTQVGGQARADHCTYLPQIGLYILVAWGMMDLCGSWRHRRTVLGSVAAVVITTLSVASFIQTSYWRNSESLWMHTLTCTSDNAIAHNNLGNVFLEQERLDQAIAQFQKALEIKTNYAKTYYNLGTSFLHQWRLNEAIAQFQKALEIEPDYVDAHGNLGLAFVRQGRMGEAIPHYQRALEIKPDYPEILNNLAWVLATCPQASLRNGNQAVELARRANQLTGDNDPLLLRTLATAYAEAGRFPEAVETAQRALQLAEAQSNNELADVIRSQLKLFQAGVPFHLN